MMEEEITESTVLIARKNKGPSFLANVVVLGLLVAAILAAQQWTKRGSPKPLLLEEEFEKEIVLEDLETQKPLVESESVKVPVSEEPSKPVEVQTKRKKPKVAKKNVPLREALDPYTSGGPLDLDRPENWNQFFPGRPKEGYVKQKVRKGGTEEATASPPLPKERERFIPFESE